MGKVRTNIEIEDTYVQVIMNRYGVRTEEVIEDPDIFVCRGLKGSWEDFWKRVKLFA